MANKIHVVVADDHDCIRAGVRYLLQGRPNIEIVGEATDTRALEKLLDALTCDVVVSDIGMPGLEGGGNAVPLLRRLLRRKPHPRVVVLTIVSHAHMLTGLRSIGVSGIVDKRDAAETLIDAIEAVAAGRTHLSPQVQAVLETVQPRPQLRTGAMSVREWEVFQLYARGLAVHEIAVRLRRSGKTISTQKRSAMRKLGLETEGDLINYASQIGLI
ncbi:response regulator transcription factor [Paraburkholderia susongensis]|uniref:Two component transcriptional regulator, LuxR family n=1 Tax=Paraburkholderia susongensis TaxID=1515439 RepID=A0A1X7JTE6_9BURK|nr:response regulator transcription factor [Paraburkholderia susongensis]SMG31430.1 two component transcriptional regulator, LuxR family [Paraburkholderia susongensis]